MKNSARSPVLLIPASFKRDVHRGLYVEDWGSKDISDEIVDMDFE
ncbi:MAG: hypothetical protein V3U84_12185 [Thiotrichaceae bacterium]